MAKKKEAPTLDEVRRCVKLHQSFHNTKLVNIEVLAKELGMKKLDLWEFILKNEPYFVMEYWGKDIQKFIEFRFVKEVLEQPMSEEMILKMKTENHFFKYQEKDI